MLAAQRWIADNYAIAAPVAEMVRRSRLSSRTFKRRFRAATGETTISYVQRIRVERAKRALETGSAPIEEISWAVGYEDPASFRRLFKRVTGLTPGEYRRRFQLPDLPHVRPLEPRAVAYQRTASSPQAAPRHRGRSARDAQPRPRDECPRRPAHRTTPSGRRCATSATSASMRPLRPGIRLHEPGLRRARHGLFQKPRDPPLPLSDRRGRAERLLHTTAPDEEQECRWDSPASRQRSCWRTGSPSARC